MTKDFICQYIKKHKLAVIAAISGTGKPESALVGIAVTDELEIIFDTVKTSRKYSNIISNPSVSIVIGWEDETTLQYEGQAAVINEADGKYKEVYFSVFPDGRQRSATWPAIVHFKVTPTWVRYSNFNDPQIIEEMLFS